MEFFLYVSICRFRNKIVSKRLYESGDARISFRDDVDILSNESVPFDSQLAAYPEFIQEKKNQIYNLDSQIDSFVFRNKYGLYATPKNHDRPAVNKIRNGEVYESATLSFLKKYYVSGTDVVHAGTYFGDMLPFYSRLVGTLNAVWAFEPIPLHFVCAEKTIELNGLRNIFLNNMALSNETDILEMETSCGGISKGGGSNISTRQSTHCEYELVRAVRLDDLLLQMSRKVSVIHLDVEGHELLALRGAAALLQRDNPTIILEVWESQKKNIERFMEDLQYRKVRSVDGNSFFVPIMRRRARQPKKVR